MKIFTRYILKDFFLNSLLSLMLFIFILLMDRVFQIVDLLVTKGMDFSVALTLVIYSLPTLLVLSSPMAIVSGAILSFGKMASEGEITVIRTSGNSLAPVVLPVISACIILALMMVPFNYDVAPLSQYKFRNTFLKIAMKNAALRLEESTLVDIPPYTIMCLKVDHKRKKIQEIVIYKDPDSSNPSLTITARSGSWESDNDGNLVLNLYDGAMKYQPEDKLNKLSSVSFDDYKIQIMSPKGISKKNKSIETMTGAELKREIALMKEKKLPTHKLQTRYFLRGSLAGAIPVLLLVGIPLGIRAEKKGKTIGIGLSIGIIAAYYFLMVAGIKLSFSKHLYPWFGVWMPNIITGISGIILLRSSYYK